MKRIFLIATLVATAPAMASNNENSTVVYDKGELVVSGPVAERTFEEMAGDMKQMRENAGEFEKVSGDTTCTFSAANDQTVCVIKVVTARKIH